VSLLVGLTTLGNNLFCWPILQACLRFYPELAARAELGSLKWNARRELTRTTVLLVALILVIGPILSYKSDELRLSTFVALAAIVVIETARTLDFVLLNAGQRHQPFALWSVLEAWLRPVCAILAVRLWGAEPGVVLVGYAVGSGGLYLFMHVATRRDFGPRSDVVREREFRREMWAYALPLIPVALVGWVCSLSDRYIIGYYRGLEDVGIYAAAYGLAGKPISTLSSALTFTFRPIYFEACSANDHAAAKRVFRAWIAVTLAAGGAVVAMFYLFGALVVRITLNVRYRSVEPYLPMIALGYVMMALSQVFNTASMARKKSSATTISEASGAVASIAFEVPLIAWRGIKGAAMAVPLYYGVQCLVAVLLAWRVGGLRTSASDSERSGSARTAATDETSRSDRDAP
jgi:O-antigen/teichoic acid export membrane protein